MGQGNIVVFSFGTFFGKVFSKDRIPVADVLGCVVKGMSQVAGATFFHVSILNTINFKKSMHYNPFAYVHSEKDILKLVTTLMTNTKGEGSAAETHSGRKAERLLLTALIAYLHYEAPVEEQNFATLLEMLNTMQVLEDDEEYQNPVDLLFEELAKKKPNSFAGRQYKLYKLAAGKTAKSILISCGARLAPFDIQELRDLTMYDELQLDTLGDKKTALFLIMSRHGQHLQLPHQHGLHPAFQSAVRQSG